MDAGKVETETITEGDGDAAQGPGVACWRTCGSATASPRSRRSAPTTRSAPSPSPSTTSSRSSWPASRTPRSAPGSRSRPRPRRRSARPATPSSASATRTPCWSSSTWSPRCSTSPRASDVARPRTGCRPSESEKGVLTGFDFAGTPAPTADLRRVQLIKGTGPRVEKGQTIAVRYLGEVFGGDKPFDENFSGEGTPTTFAIGDGTGHQGLGQGPRRRPGRLPGRALDPAGARLRRDRQRAGRHQGHRHAGLRDRHPCRCLTRGCDDQVVTGHDSPEERAPAQPADHAARAAALRPQGADPADPLPGLDARTRSRRCSSATRTSCAASAYRSRSARWTRSSTTSRATGSAPTSSRSPTSASPPTRPRSSAWPPRSGSTPGWPRPPPRRSASSPRWASTSTSPPSTSSSPG